MVGLRELCYSCGRDNDGPLASSYRENEMKQILLAAIFAVATLTLAPAAIAQSLAEGKWTGTMETPDGEVVDLTYEVKKDGDVLMISLLPPEGAGADSDRYEFSDVRMEDGNLVFWWQPGPRVDCVLEPVDDGAYDGECSIESGELCRRVRRGC